MIHHPTSVQIQQSQISIARSDHHSGRRPGFGRKRLYGYDGAFGSEEPQDLPMDHQAFPVESQGLSKGLVQGP